MLFSCKNKTTDLNKDAAIKPNQFIAAFKLIENGFTANDTNIFKLADTVSINHNLLSRFIPDSIVNQLIAGDKKTIFHSLGRISKSTETYILLLSVKNKKPYVSVIVFDKENKFLAEKDLLLIHNDEGYKYNLSINKEPTFFVGREKMVNDKEIKFTRTGWIFNGKNFIAAVKESNERSDKLMPIINPIDSLMKYNMYSGTYVQDDRNFIAIRDGKSKTEYLFFLHIEKNDGNCIGELKGTMQLVDSTHAIYSFGGDPCVIDFAFSNNDITIKEKGSCGNRRGMDCYFDDSYTKRKEVKKQLPKTSLITVKAVPVAKPKPIAKSSNPTKSFLLPNTNKQKAK
ncbi:MAG: hypothetical protein NTZ59_12190, partial [Bacteroidetes bacterium]|nr:hypothetical protein [Bacteroidota bacterium]